MDLDEAQPGGTTEEFAALTQRVAELERVVAELRLGRPAPAALVRPQARTAPPPIPFVTAKPEAQSSVPLASAAPPKSLEDRLGSQVFNMVGIFALVCGSAYFLKLAIDHGWLGYTARVLIGLLAGAGLVVWSESFRRKKLPAFSYSLKAVGTAILYLSLWAAFHLYHLLPGPVALAAMILVTAWNAYMAVTQDAELLAGYALAGGLLTPVLLSSGGNHETFLFTYLVAIALGIVYLLRTKKWSWLLIPTFLGVVGYFIAWYAEFFHPRAADLWNGESTETALFAVIFFAIYALPTVKGWSQLPDAAPGGTGALVPVLLPLGDAVFLALALYSVFEDSGLHSSLAFLMVALAALYLGVMRLQRTSVAGAMYLASAVVCLTVAVPLKASGHSLTTAWLVEGLILYWAGSRLKGEARGQDRAAPAKVLWILSLGGYVLGLSSLVAHWGFSMLFDSQNAFFTRDLAAAMVAVATLSGAVWLAHQRKDAGVQGVALLTIDGVALLLALRELLSWSAGKHTAFATADFASALLGLALIAATCYAAYRISAGRSPIAAATLILANLVAILIFVREIGALFTSGEADLQRSLAISGFLMVYGAALLAIGFVKQSAFVRWQALVLLIFTIGKVFLYDMSGLSAGYRVASLMGLGAVLMGVSYAYQKDWLGLKTPAAAPPAPLEEGPAMKLVALVLLTVALWQADGHVSPELKYFRYQRTVGSAHQTPANSASGPACAAIDADVYAHSNELADVRLFDGTREVPYALSTSQTAPMGDAAKVLNAGLQGTHVAFDLEMPSRAYTDVKLDLAGQNYVAAATVTGKQSPADAHATALGSFTLFDLSSTGLGQSTTLKLVESTFPYLHVDLALTGAGGRPFVADAAMITGAEVPPSREAQTLYTTVAQTAVITRVGRHSVANFKLPAHVPVERVTFALAPGDRTNFSRSVSILAHANTANPQDPESRESVAGMISRINLVEGGKELREETLSVPATLGANMDQAADVQVWVENGDDQPLALASVKLEMRQRLLCFHATPSIEPTLYYGDAKLAPPVYDYSRTFDPGQAPLPYELGAETPNPVFTPRVVPDTRTIFDKYPEIIWAGLLVVVAALGFVAYRSAKRI